MRCVARSAAASCTSRTATRPRWRAQGTCRATRSQKRRAPCQSRRSAAHVRPSGLRSTGRPLALVARLRRQLRCRTRRAARQSRLRLRILRLRRRAAAATTLRARSPRRSAQLTAVPARDLVEVICEIWRADSTGPPLVLRQCRLSPPRAPPPDFTFPPPSPIPCSVAHRPPLRRPRRRPRILKEGRSRRAA